MNQEFRHAAQPERMETPEVPKMLPGRAWKQRAEIPECRIHWVPVLRGRWAAQEARKRDCRSEFWPSNVHPLIASRLSPMPVSSWSKRHCFQCDRKRRAVEVGLE